MVSKEIYLANSIEHPAQLPIDWDRLESFVGFGRPGAPVVFVRVEEGLRDSAALVTDLAFRSGYKQPVMDLKEAHRGIPGTEHYFEENGAPRQPTWRVMADLMLRRADVAQPTRIDRRRYRALHLGRAEGDTLLTELLPYPHPRQGDWLYGCFGKFRTRDAYEEAMLPRRKRLLKRVLAAAPREIVVCYGKARWPHFQSLFEGTEWRPDGQNIVGNAGGTRVVLTNHFASGDFNTSAQLAGLARAALLVLRKGRPQEFDQLMNSIRALIESGGEVSSASLAERLRRSQAISIAFMGHRIAAVCVLKGVRQVYNRHIADVSAFPLSDCVPEFGYAVTDSQYRRLGLGGSVAASLLKSLAQTVFAVARVENLSINRILMKNNFQPVGSTWRSQMHPDESLQLWLREPQ